MNLKTKLKTWLITKIASDTLVIANATLLYKYYPIFADIEKNPILVNNRIIKSETDTPFLVYHNSIMLEEDNELKIKPEHIEAYNAVLNAIEETIKEADIKDKEKTDE